MLSVDFTFGVLSCQMLCLSFPCLPAAHGPTGGEVPRHKLCDD